jgi:hypothetical protein
MVDRLAEAVKHEVARLAGVTVEDVEREGTERIQDYRSDAYIFRGTTAQGRRWQAKMTRYEFVRLDPPKDPFVEAFKTIALALHEAEKKADFERWMEEQDGCPND